MPDIESIVKRQKVFFQTGRTKSIAFRLRQLEALKGAVLQKEAALTAALKEDLNKAPYESYLSEIGFIFGELDDTIKHLKAWARPKRVKTPAAQFPSVSRIYPEPYGVVLILSPWNYPVQLTLAPLIGAIAAGNCCIIKPSACSERTAEVIARMIEETFHSAYITVLQGGREINRALLDQKFDYLFFTGGVEAGRAVMEAAARHLTPVSLELGGKSPCIVDETADLKLAARRIIWGKFLNAGQTCVAPDYVLVHHTVKKKLLFYMKHYITRFYGENPCLNPDYPRIINKRHFNRLLGLMEGEIKLCGGRASEETLQIEPVILPEVTWESPVMKEEIFGPILPVLEFESLKKAVSRVSREPKPLAAYLFTKDKKRERYVLRRLSFGGGCINDTIIHLTTPHLPFGGVGDSGMGGYHGKWSFETFSHKKGILSKSVRLDLPVRYPPYERHCLRLVKKIYGKAGELWTW